MNLRFAIEPDDTLVVHLREGETETTVAVSPSRAGVRSLRRALVAAIDDGYGECFWPAKTGGQYWWMFKREAETLETVAMWTRGGAAPWQHVFRATDAAAFVHERLDAEMDRLDLSAPID
jgi:hypothetical protein